MKNLVTRNWPAVIQLSSRNVTVCQLSEYKILLSYYSVKFLMFDLESHHKLHSYKS